MALRHVMARAFVPILASLSVVGGDGIGGGRLLDDSVSLLSVDVRGRPPPGVDSPQSWSWDVVSAWVRDNGGGGALASLTTNDTEHGGYRVRGVIAREPIISGTIVLQIPQRLWIWLDNFPDMKKAKLPAKPVCRMLSAPAEDNLKIATAMARELHKGQASFFFPWLQTLPTLDGFREFHPRLASEAVLADFEALSFAGAEDSLVHRIRLSQHVDKGLQKCFEAWQQQPQSLVADLTWEKVHGALLLFQTRAYSVRTSNGTVADAMVPLSEFLNTGRKEAMNTNWWPVRPNRDFKLKLLGNLRAGDELLDSYCTSCTNVAMLDTWGLYLEDTSRRLAPFAGACGFGAGSEARARLETAARAMLDVAGARASWASPRCWPSALAREQGPLRCSLARLAWEQCGL